MTDKREDREALIEEAAKAAYEGAFLRHAPEEVDRWGDLVADNHPAVESWREVARQVLAVFERLPDADAVMLERGDVFTALRRPVQGEPTNDPCELEPTAEPVGISDEQVLAALNAEGKSTHVARRPFNPAPDLSYYAIEHVEAMRAALRAAAAVREEG